ncbi:putative transposase [Oceanicola granulosus HTCC2516]|uniref:Putative transposase n=1 Tax=Oceanicola granulosus (strain ATCC BAA-861 / DSM 15982 / KCTC 12143 / HTCC2516) TaxID=314256 RepID=Q2CH27_OCEGH|nr:putative transposase [Oceanicola granulosus HTCC2516]
MKNDTDMIPLRQPHSLDDPLTEIAREGARRMLAAALRAEADTFVAELVETRLPDGRQRVVRHGYGPEREKARGLTCAPEIAVGDGALGFWKALDEVFPSTRRYAGPVRFDGWEGEAPITVRLDLPEALPEGLRTLFGIG